MEQAGRSVVGSSWRKMGTCGAVGVWESIRMEVSRDLSLL